MSNGLRKFLQTPEDNCLGIIVVKRNIQNIASKGKRLKLNDEKLAPLTKL